MLKLFIKQYWKGILKGLFLLAGVVLTAVLFNGGVFHDIAEKNVEDLLARELFLLIVVAGAIVK